MATKDSDFEKRLKKRMEESGWYVHKIPDKTPPIKSEGTESEGKYTTKNKFDFIVLESAGNGAWWARALEAKSCADKRLDFDRVKKHQEDGLEEFPGASGLVVEFRVVHEAYYVDIARFIKFRKECGKKSMNLADARSIGLVIPRNTRPRERKDYYDMSVLPKTQGDRKW